jgi:hypothetical protein
MHAQPTGPQVVLIDGQDAHEARIVGVGRGGLTNLDQPRFDVSEKWHFSEPLLIFAVSASQNS